MEQWGDGGPPRMKQWGMGDPQGCRGHSNGVTGIEGMEHGVVEMKGMEQCGDGGPQGMEKWGMGNPRDTGDGAVG